MKVSKAIVALAAAATLFTLSIPSGTLWASASNPKSSPRRTGSAATKGQSLSPPIVPIQNQRGIYVYSEHPENPTDFSQTVQALSVNGVDGLTLLVGWATVEPNFDPVKRVFSWDLLDNLLKAAIRNDKHVDLAIRAGQDTPCWLFTTVSQQCGAGYTGSYAGAAPLNFLVAPVQGTSPGNTCNPITIAAPWDGQFLAEWKLMLAGVAQHLQTTYFPDQNSQMISEYDAITSIRLTGINRTTAELRLPAEILPLPCTDPQGPPGNSHTDTNSVAIWLANGYGPSLLHQAWDEITMAFGTNFPDKFFTLPIIPDASGNPKIPDYPFPQIDDNGNVYSPDPVAASDFSVPPGIACSTCTTDPMPDDNAPMLALASQNLPGRLVVAYQSLINGQRAEPYVVKTAQTLGTMTGFQTNDFVGPFQQAACSGRTGTGHPAQVCPDWQSYLGLVEIGIFPTCPVYYPKPNPPNAPCRTKLRSQYIEILPPDAIAFPDAIWQAHMELTDYAPPVTGASITGPPGLNGWYLGSVVLNFHATDDLSGVATTKFSKNNGSTWTTGNSLSLTADGIHNILFRSTDVAGNVETPKSIIVDLDDKPPVTTVTTHLRSFQGVPISLIVNLNAFDNVSGVALTEYSLDHGSTWTTGNVLYLCGGTKRILYYSTDMAGNVERQKSITLSTPVCGGP